MRHKYAPLTLLLGLLASSGLFAQEIPTAPVIHDLDEIPPAFQRCKLNFRAQYSESIGRATFSIDASCRFSGYDVVDYNNPAFAKIDPILIRPLVIWDPSLMPSVQEYWDSLYSAVHRYQIIQYGKYHDAEKVGVKTVVAFRKLLSALEAMNNLKWAADDAERNGLIGQERARFIIDYVKGGSNYLTLQTEADVEKTLKEMAKKDDRFQSWNPADTYLHSDRFRWLAQRTDRWIVKTMGSMRKAYLAQKFEELTRVPEYEPAWYDALPGVTSFRTGMYTLAAASKHKRLGEKMLLDYLADPNLNNVDPDLRPLYQSMAQDYRNRAGIFENVDENRLYGALMLANGNVELFREFILLAGSSGLLAAKYGAKAALMPWYGWTLATTMNATRINEYLGEKFVDFVDATTGGSATAHYIAGSIVNIGTVAIPMMLMGPQGGLTTIRSRVIFPLSLGGLNAGRMYLMASCASNAQEAATYEELSAEKRAENYSNTSAGSGLYMVSMIAGAKAIARDMIKKGASESVARATGVAFGVGMEIQDGLNDFNQIVRDKVEGLNDTSLLWRLSAFSLDSLDGPISAIASATPGYNQVKAATLRGLAKLSGIDIKADLQADLLAKLKELEEQMVTEQGANELAQEICEANQQQLDDSPVVVVEDNSSNQVEAETNILTGLMDRLRDNKAPVIQHPSSEPLHWYNPSHWPRIAIQWWNNFTSQKNDHAGRIIPFASPQQQQNSQSVPMAMAAGGEHYTPTSTDNSQQAPGTSRNGTPTGLPTVDAATRRGSSGVGKSQNDQTGSSEVYPGLPLDLMEELRVVPPDSAEGVIFQNEMLALAKRLDPDHNFDAKPLRFLLLDDNQPNAYYLRGITPRTIALTRGLFLPFDIHGASQPRILDTLDKLAFIVRHEGFHLFVDVNFKRERNSKVEELLADVYFTESIHDAGLDIREGIALMQRLEEVDSNFWHDDLTRIVDPHPNSDNRVTAMEGAVAKIDHERGGLRNSPTPIATDSDLYRAVLNGKHDSYVADKLRAANYTELATTERLAVLTSILQETTYLNRRRILELEKELEELGKDKNIENSASEHNALVNTILDMGDRFGYRVAKRLYIALLAFDTTATNPTAPPKGRLAILASAMQSFIDARGTHAIKLRAKELHQAIEAEPISHTAEGVTFLKTTITWPYFSKYKKVQAQMKTTFIDRFYHRFGAGVEKEGERLTPEQEQQRREQEAVKDLHEEIRREGSSRGTRYFGDDRYQDHVAWSEHLAVARAGKEDNDVIRALLTLGIDDPRLFNDSCISANLAYRLLEKQLPVISPLGFGDYVYYNLRVRTRSHDKGLELVLLLQIFENQLWLQGKKENYRGEYETSEDILDEPNAPNELRDMASKAGSIADYSKQYASIRNLCNGIRKMLKAKVPGIDSAVRDLYLKGNFIDAIFDPPIGDQRNPFVPKETYLQPRNLSLTLFLEIKDLFSQEEQAKIYGLFLQDLIVGEIGIHSPHVEHSNKSSLIVDGAAGLDELIGYVRPTLATIFPGYPSEGFKDWGHLATYLKSNRSFSQELTVLLQNFVEAEALVLVYRHELDAKNMLSILAFLGREKTGILMDHSPTFNGIVSVLVDGELDRISNRTATANIDQYEVFKTLGLLTPDRDSQYLSICLNQIKQLKRISTKRKLLERVMGAGRILNPELRNTVTELWSDTVLADHGKDDGSSRYQTALFRGLNPLLAKLNVTDKHNVLSTLAVKVTSQRRLTRKLQHELPGLSSAVFQKGLLFGILGEQAYNALKRKPDYRQAMLEFLVEPLSSKSVSTVKSKASDLWEPKSHLLAHDGRDTNIQHAQNSYLIDSLLSQVEAIAQREADEKIQAIHGNFWAAPLAVRAVVAKELLNIDGNNGAAQQDANFDTVINAILGEDQRTGPMPEMLRAYVRALPPYLQPLYLAAMMVAAQKSQEGGLRVGQAIALLAENLGPAETKVAQAAESHPDVDAEIRQDLRRLKYRADEPLRWDLQQWMDDLLPKDLRNDIVHIGDLLGSGSLYVVVEVTMKNGEKMALALLRPYAKNRSDNGFMTMSHALTSLGENHPHYDTLQELLHQGQRQSALEMDASQFAPQFVAAQEMYNATTVSIDGEVFSFSVPDLVAHGEGYKLMRLAKGAHFLELRQRTDQQRERKRLVAMAILTLEINNIVTGLPFDNDRHGGNNKIHQSTVAHFDLGSIVLEEQPDAAYVQLTEVLFGAIMASDSATGFAEQILAQVRQLRDLGIEVHELVTRVQKALLSLGDYLDLLSPEDLKRVLFAGCMQGNQHPAIRQTAMRLIMQQAQSGSNGLGQQMFTIPPDQQIIITR